GPKRTTARCLARSASTARSRGGALVTSECRSSRATSVVRSTARRNAASFICDGRLKPESLRTNWSAAARISSSLTGGSKLNSVLMLRHMPVTIPRGPRRDSLAGEEPQQEERELLLPREQHQDRRQETLGHTGLLAPLEVLHG